MADSPAQRIFGTPADSAVADDELASTANSPSALPNRRPSRISFTKRSSFSRWRSQADEEMGDGGGGTPVPPPIPSALQQSNESTSTPLPMLSMIVLSIALLGEFLTANVSMPFLLFMVDGFGVLNEEADVGFWTGILVAAFFLTQFMTSLLWATVADKYGRRLVLFVSLLGTSFTCCAFGTSVTLREAIAIRLLQGIFGGAVGVARGCVTVVTDPSNEGRAYAILGFCWGFGGVAGAIIGGTFESPATKWPGIFGSVPLFVKYPYVLPTIMAASVTFIGSILSLFLGPDGGPRTGAIQLSAEKDLSGNDPNHPTIPEEDSAPASPLLSPTLSPSDTGIYGSIRRKVKHKVSDYFANRVKDAHASDSPGEAAVPMSIPGSGSNAAAGQSSRAASRTSRFNGSAYGYGGASMPRASMAFRQRLESRASASAQRGSTSSGTMRGRRASVIPGSLGAGGAGGGHEGGVPSSYGQGDLNFAQRLLMANENAVTNIADLWVASAMNVDNEDVFESDSEMGGDEDAEDDNDNDDDAVGLRDEDEEDDDELDGSPVRSRGEGMPSVSPSARRGRRTSQGSNSVSQNQVSLGHGTPRRMFGAAPAAPTSRYRPSFGVSSAGPHSPMGRMPSLNLNANAVSPSEGATPPAVGGGNVGTFRRMSAVPSIFAHPGVQTPPAVLEAQKLLELGDEGTPGEVFSPYSPLSGDARGGGEAQGLGVGGEAEVGQEEQGQGQGLMKQLPVMIIVQYGLLALHSTTHDMIFLSYLNSPYESGGLNLNAGHFAQLTALMCLAQIAYQFYLYPNIGPPRGRFSHLAMFRLGSLLFIPGYITVTWYRVFASASEDGNFLLMACLAVSTAVRFCGNTFAYTAISILLNYMSPPHVVGLANGIAQSIVSLARCFGPILGGLLWSVSVEGNPSGYPIGFWVCAAVCALSVLHSMLIR
ncbi:major facilitator MFS-1 [Stereum hirsutum FP-91666 SS1]|uniref:major facilitator MFS-1 n=1 Tax=Stereum hirsutum (strain FP-91666) TaxID=721885 RepID=UPI000440F5D7|nr:major facilitator MFS-1 [Stereum hirsutum FP-91666 SS1]EIM88851.1 major facilitator MFS-1 [Stereum hirsutum FP-91666 SS1]